MPAVYVPAVAGDAVDILTTQIGTFGPSLLVVGGLAVGAAAGVLLLRKGWNLVRGLIK